MTDILSSAQSTQDPVGSSPPTIPPEPPPEPLVKPENPPDKPPQPSPTASFDSFVVPPTNDKTSSRNTSSGNANDISSSSQTKQPLSGKKRFPKGTILAGILLLLISLPLVVFFVTQQKQQNDLRTNAATIPGPYPPWTACDNVGDKTTGPKGECLECKTNSSNPDLPLAWAPCGGTTTCPWNTDPCCPANGDACDFTAGQTKCIQDPFNSRCVKWGDGSCPGGGGVWQQEHSYSDCTTEGCGSDSNLICVQGVGPKGENLCRNSNCLDKSDCICPDITITPGPTKTPPTKTPTPSNTPTATATPGPQCTRIRIYYKGGPNDGTEVTDYSTLKGGDVVTITVDGTLATKARVRVNGGAWTETETKNSNEEFTVDLTLPTTGSSITIEAETYGSDNQWH
jgi:hypothetical protein